jgi:hypothetical protein
MLLAIAGTRSEPRHPRHQVDDVGLLQRLWQVVVEPRLAVLPQ